MTEAATVVKLATKTLPKTHFDKVLDGVIWLTPLVTTAISIKFVFRGNRV